MRDGFQMVARIPWLGFPSTSLSPVKWPPWPYSVPMGCLSLKYRYSPAPNNAAEAVYIFMEFLQGTKLSDIWFELGEGEIISVSRRLAELESELMSIAFPAGGTREPVLCKDMEKVAGRPGIPLEDARFCVGLDTRLPLWYGRRSQLDVDRGPCRPLSALFAHYSLKLTGSHRRKYRSSARKSSR